MSTELKTVGFLVETEFLFPDEVPEGYVEGTDLVDRSEAEAEIARLRSVIQEAADYDFNPFEPDNQSNHYKRMRAALNPGEQDGR